MHPGRAYAGAQDVLNNYYNQAQGYQQPYNQMGINQGANQNKYIEALMNPQALEDQWSKGYKESDAAKNLEDMAQQHGLNAASGLGLNGSSAALDAIQAGTSRIGAEDRQQYLNDLMEKYKMGAGLSQNIFNTGANAANQMGQNAMNMGTNSAGLKFNEMNAGGSQLGQVGGAAMKALMDYLTGGFGTGSMGRGAWSTGGG